ncbi:MAG: cation:proton antiporter [Zetaproteobacteria bacterium]|nr:cation:proton antiporter [Zetaproteobacteria bacterium]
MGSLFFIKFAFICIASIQLGRYFIYLGLPKITGYLFCGLVAGPSILGFVDHAFVAALKDIDGAALAFIGMSAGSELYWKGLRPLVGKVTWIACSVMSITFAFMCASFFLMMSYTQTLGAFSGSMLFAVSCLAGTIFVARSPSSAIAVVNEIKAHGPFTQMSLGVTVILDIVVIVMFSMVSLLTRPVLMEQSFQFLHIFKVFGEMFTSLGLGCGLGWIASWLYRTGLQGFWLGLSWLLLGVVFYSFGNLLGDRLDWHIENTVVFLVNGFYLTNFCTSQRFLKSFMHKITPVVYIAFFTLTGASLNIRLFEAIWPITLALFLIRIFAIYTGATAGSLVAQVEAKHRKYFWMSFVTQAGVGLGLAKKVADAYPEWGGAFATVIISVIIMNEILGPPLFKHALRSTGESNTGAKKSERHAKPCVYVFGTSPSAEALCRQLVAHAWKVTLVHPEKYEVTYEVENLVRIPFQHLNRDFIEELDSEDEFTFVLMLEDRANRRLSKLLSVKHPDAHMVVTVADLESRIWFDNMDVSLVDRHTAFISLLDHYVRTPSAVSLLMGYEKDVDVTECVIQNPYFSGKRVDELDLAPGVLVLSVRRHGEEIHFHEGLCLEQGDRLTFIGNKRSLEEVEYRFMVKFAT